MIEYLKLTNFKRHENLELDLEGGLVVLAGANEAGKSSILHAILYALYGARSLPRSLEGTVTYGKPVTSLRVDMRFKVSGVPYTIYRAKSGAELSGGGALCSGQAEVTARVEQLLGVPMTSAIKLLVANQGSLRGVVEEGSAAVKLIEELAELDVIETLVEKMQDQLPTGNTRALSEQAAAVADLPEPVLEVVDLSEVTYLRDSVKAAAEIAAESVKQAEAAAEGAELAADAGKRLVADAARLGTEAARLRSILARPEPAPLVMTVTDISVLQAAMQAQSDDGKIRAAWLTWQGLTEVADPGPAPFVPKSSVISDLKLARQAVFLRRINEDNCALCGKLLQDVPEVVRGNASVDAEVAALDARIAEAQEAALEADRALLQWSIATKHFQSYQLKLAGLNGYVLNGIWVGGEVSAEPDTTDYRRLIADEQAKLQKMAVHREQVRRHAADKAEAQTALDALAIPDTTEALEAIERGQSAKTALAGAIRHASAVNAEFQAASSAFAALQRRSDAAKARYEAEVAALEAAKLNRTRILELISQTETHNALIKKLRLARPALASKLWGALLGAISRVFSDLRGTSSTVTRSADGFEVDGKPVADLSGSTLDILGLAVRVSLLRAFLPGVGLLVLDEPSAACDAEREAALLGAVAASGFEQILLVSHSDAAKAVASQLVLI